MFKEGKSLSGKALHLHLWKAFWPICLTSPLSRLKVIFLIFHTSLPPCSSLHMAVLGNPLKKGQSVCWANCFFPIGNISTTFFGKCGCSPSVRCYFLSQNELYFHAVFHTFDRAQMNNSWVHIKPWKYEYGKKETTSLNLFVNCPQIYVVVYRTSISGTKPPVQHIVYVISEQWPYSYAVRSKFFESDSPISSPSLAWLPWPFSRGVPLSISKLTPYAEDSLCGRERVGEAFKKNILLTSASVLDLYDRGVRFAMQFGRGYGVYFDGHSVLWHTFGLTNVETA